MLPSQGLFKSIPCPFFEIGLCERANCSFRHRTSDVPIPMDSILMEESIDELEFGEELSQGKESNGKRCAEPETKDANERRRRSAGREKTCTATNNALTAKFSSIGSGSKKVQIDFTWDKILKVEKSRQASPVQNNSKESHRQHVRKRMTNPSSESETGKIRSNKDRSIEESAFKPGVVNDSMNLSFPPGKDKDPKCNVMADSMEIFGSDSNVEVSSQVFDQDLDERFSVIQKRRVAHYKPNATLNAASATRPVPGTRQSLRAPLLKRFNSQIRNMSSALNGKPRALPSMVGSISKPAKMRIAHVPDVEDPSQQLIPIIPIVKQHPPVGQKLSEQPGSSFYSKTITKEVKYGQSSNVLSQRGPMVLRDAIKKSTRIPYSTRQQIMDAMFAEYVRILKDHGKAFQKTLIQEDELIGKCISKHVYYNCGISVITKLRKSVVDI